jgi:transposase
MIVAWSRISLSTHRQVKVMQAVLDPLGMSVATDVVSGERADDPL